VPAVNDIIVKDPDVAALPFFVARASRSRPWWTTSKAAKRWMNSSTTFPPSHARQRSPLWSWPNRYLFDELG